MRKGIIILVLVESCNLFAEDFERIESGGKVRILAAANGRAEAVFAAKEIRRLVKEEGLRYRDVAVIASDIGSYQHYIKYLKTNFQILKL